MRWNWTRRRRNETVWLSCRDEWYDDNYCTSRGVPWWQKSSLVNCVVAHDALPPSQVLHARWISRLRCFRRRRLMSCNISVIQSSLQALSVVISYRYHHHQQQQHSHHRKERCQLAKVSSRHRTLFLTPSPPDSTELVSIAFLLFFVFCLYNACEINNAKFSRKLLSLSFCCSLWRLFQITLVF